MKKFKIIIILSILLLKSNISFSLDTTVKQAILIDANSKQILYSKNVNEKISPASLTKIMTSVIAFDLIKKGEIKLSDKFVISKKAWRMSKKGYSSMFIIPNDNISVRNLLKGIIVASGNDACIALAEGIAGTEDNFVTLMNEKATDIGMSNTNFSNASGIYSKTNYSTVSDLAILSLYMIDTYPELYKMYKQKEFEWSRTGGNPIKQPNRNSLLYKNSNVDGIKTGHLSDSGYSLSSSLKIGERRIVSVVSGAKSNAERTKESSKLLNYAIITKDLIKINKNNPYLKAQIWNGKLKNIKLILKEDVYITYPKRKSKNLSFFLEIITPLKINFKKNDNLGFLIIKDKKKTLKKIAVLASEDFKKVNFIKRFFNTVNFLIWG